MRLLRKAISVTLAIVMLASTVCVAASAQTVDDNNSSVPYKGVFYYRSGTGEDLPGTDSVDYYMIFK